jgi:hypothetical protein
MKFRDKLKKLEACSSAVEWVGDQTAKQAWNTCGNGNWMLWLIGETNPKVSLPMRKKLVLCACDIAETSLGCVPKDEPRPSEAIETARRWATGEKVSMEDVKTAANAATAAANDAYAANATAYAAYAAANAAAYAANATTYAAAYAAATAAANAAANATANAANAATYAAANAANAANDAANADIVRKYFKTCPRIKS